MKRRRTEFGKTTGRFPRCRVKAEPDGHLWISLWRDDEEYKSESSRLLYVSPAEAKLILDALRKALPVARLEAEACRQRKRAKWYRELFPSPVAGAERALRAEKEMEKR